MNWPVPEPMALAPAAEAFTPFVDPAGLGARTIGCDTFSGELLDVLRLTPDLGTPAEVEPLVRDQIARYEPERLSGLAPVMRIERAFDGRLEIWSRVAEGFRLSAALEWTEERGVRPPLAAALTIGDRLLGALVSLQALDQTEGASGHGAVAIDQIVVSESGALTLTDYAFGPLLGVLQWPRERLWRRFRIAMPPSAGLARFDHRVDVTQAALVIVSLLAGRVFRAEEYPRQLEALVEEAVRRSGGGVEREERDRLSAWLRAATELDSRSAFKTAAAARAALRASLASRVDDPAAVGRWLRAARGLAEPEPVAAPGRPRPQLVAEPAPAAEAPQGPAAPAAPPQADSKGRGRLRGWLSRS